ncbi:late secretory pathway protein AVL9 homolog [Ornithodoros turicata]|uniref:late secretory pathway protein AVL9 homolog n=1 Tax=Ornithodoros turicata TaxID=34597 RepID=UPI003138E94B
MELPGNGSPVLHVVVVGFHHIRGYQLEYAYPPLADELPEAWKHLPSLALPDGAHNYEEDTVYFHLPGLDNPKNTIFGISCYRQINAEKLLHRGSDITRSSVQKSVCVLSRLPLFGLIQAKLQLVTHAYFEERDFSKVSLLEETFCSLNSLLSSDMLEGGQPFLGLSSRDLILHFKHKAVLLFKLLLLERKVLFYKTPVKDLCSTVLTLCSLFPGLVEQGLLESASTLSGKNMQETEPRKQSLDDENPSQDLSLLSKTIRALDSGSESEQLLNKILPTSLVGDVFEDEDKLVSDIEELLDPKDKTEMRSKLEFVDDSKSLCKESIWSRVPSAIYSLASKETAMKEETSPLEDGVITFNLPESPAEDLVLQSKVLALRNEECGLPLSIFTKGSLCLPYVSLPIIDVLNDMSVRSCIVGATNDLFKQKKHLFDVIVEIDEGKINVFDSDLRRQINLTMEDLRFADYLVKNVLDESKDVFLEGTGWQGGDEWLRAQFKIYLVSLLRTAQLEEGSREQDSFNASFISTWKTTHNFKMWNSVEHPCLDEIPSGHFYRGQWPTVADMKLRISHSIQSSERGRKINQAVVSTGRAVAQTTGKVVGGALTSAKSVVSSLWSHFNVSSQESLPSKEDNCE